MSTDQNKRERVDWVSAPIVFITMPTCSKCGSPRYSKVRTEANGDSSRTRKVFCRDCGEPFKICIEAPEVPESGKQVNELI
jgi:hypothetical protein